MWPFNRHKHSGKIVGTTYYDSITGPRTIVHWHCSTCGKISTWTVRGEWTLESLQEG
jgi:hypothetical protein